MARRINLQDIRHHDMVHNTSLVRELEMAVDTVVSRHPRYAAQFFKDCGLYSLREAKTYLVNFLAEKEEHNIKSQNELFEKIAEIIDTVKPVSTARII